MCFSRIRIMVSTPRFDVHLMIDSDRQSALSLLQRSFFYDEPIAKCIELGIPTDFANAVVDDAIHGQCSFVVYDVQTNELVGLCLNEIKYRNDPHPVEEPNEKLKYILELLDHMHDKINLFDQFQTNALLHMFIVNVHPKYRGHGLSSQMILASIEHAKTLNLGGAYAEATNLYSLTPFQQHGFLVYHRLKYLEYDHVRLAQLNDHYQDQCYLVARSL